MSLKETQHVGRLPFLTTVSQILVHCPGISLELLCGAKVWPESSLMEEERNEAAPVSVCETGGDEEAAGRLLLRWKVRNFILK